MRRILAFAAALTIGACSEPPTAPQLDDALLTSALAPGASVTTDANAGPGSLRAALASGQSPITIHPTVGTISITSTLKYTGTAPIVILGTGQTVHGGGLGNTLLEITNGADLTIANLTFSDGGAGVSMMVAGRGSISMCLPHAQGWFV